MRVPILILWTGFCGVCSPAAVAAGYESGQVLSCDEPAQTTTHLLTPDVEGLKFQVAGPKPVRLLVDERGQDLDIDAEAIERVDIQLPPRYGRTLLTLRPGTTLLLRRNQPNRARGEFDTTLLCSPSAQVEARLSSFRLAAPLIARARRPQSVEQADLLLSELWGLDERSKDEWMHALLLHAVAQTLLMSGRSLPSAGAFASAERAWLDAGDSGRAVAGRVGRVEELLHAGQYKEVLALVPAGADLSRASYFHVRLYNDRCATLHTIGRDAEARVCYAKTLDALEQSDERIEYVSTLQSRAMVEQSLGNLESAADIARRALPLAQGPSAPVVRGRLHLLLSGIAASEGRVGDALHESDAALAEFSLDGTARWKANTLIGLARIYTDLGTYDEAYLAVAEAFGLLSPKDARSRVASALVVLSTLDRKNRRFDDGLRWAEEAERLFDDLEQPPDLRLAHTEKLKLLLDRGDFDDLQGDSLLSAANDVSDDTALIATELALHRRDLAQAEARLAALDDDRLSLSQRIWVARLRAGYHMQRGEREIASKILLDAKHRIDSLAQLVESATLRYLLTVAALPLRGAAQALVVDDTSENPTSGDLDWLWRWSVESNPIAARRSSVPAPVGSVLASLREFDRALAAELLPSMRPAMGAGDAVASSRLLHVLSGKRSGGGLVSHRVPDLAQFRQSLPHGAAAVTYIDAGARGFLLWITRDEARLLRSGAPRALRERIAALNERVRAVGTPVAVIDAAALELARSLWPEAPAYAPPAELLVLSDEVLRDVAWSLLPWPGSREPLLETTAVGSVSVALEEPGESSPNRVIETHTFVSAQRGDGSLPHLVSAPAEPALVRATLQGGSFNVRDAEPATREGVLSALAASDTWVHVASHGTVRPGRVGFAGLWLDDSEQLSFLSWLDVMEHDVAARLVVLNACQLGEDSGAIANGSSSFAAALVYSGARAVVAARWPVSDSASTLWVPAFYGALASDPHRDSIAALRMAQKRLRDSRAFRHPYYWASLASFSRYAVSDLAGSSEDPPPSSPSHEAPVPP